MSLYLTVPFQLPHSDPTAALRKLFLDSVSCEGTKRVYAQAFDEMLELMRSENAPLTRALFHVYRDRLINKGLSPSTVNTRLAAIRKLAREARDNNVLGAEEAAKITTVKNVPDLGAHKGNWLTQKEAKLLVAAPNSRRLIGKRDIAILRILLSCALRRAELANLTLKHIQKRDGRWLIVDLRGKAGRKRTVALPLSAKKALDVWLKAAGITSGFLFRRLTRTGRILPGGFSGWAVWNVVANAAARINKPKLGPHDLRRTCAKLCRNKGGDIEQIQFLLGHGSVATTQTYLGTKQELDTAVNDNLGI